MVFGEFWVDVIVITYFLVNAERLSLYVKFVDGATSMNLRATNFKVSSNKMTGIEIFNTAHHSLTVSGQTENTTDSISTYNIIKWRVMERAIAEISHMLVQGGIANRDWFSDKLFNQSTNH
jgi:hypothetical protein